jgi:hypothetical protein
MGMNTAIAWQSGGALFSGRDKARLFPYIPPPPVSETGIAATAFLQCEKATLACACPEKVPFGGWGGMRGRNCPIMSFPGMLWIGIKGSRVSPRYESIGKGLETQQDEVEFMRKMGRRLGILGDWESYYAVVLRCSLSSTSCDVRCKGQYTTYAATTKKPVGGLKG